MNTLLEKRYKNAIKVADKLNSYIDNPEYLVFDEDNELVTFPIKIKEDGDIVRPLSDTCSIIFFMNDDEYDHGAGTTIKDFNKEFEKWKVIPVSERIKLKF